jgi:hypothetical protein
MVAVSQNLHYCNGKGCAVAGNMVTGLLQAPKMVDTKFSLDT